MLGRVFGRGGKAQPHCRWAPAAAAQPAALQVVVASTGEGVPGVAPLGSVIPTQPEAAPPKRSPAHYLWAVLIARIYEVRADRLSITEGAQIKRILKHIGVDSEPPHMSPAHGSPLWDDSGDAQMGEDVEIEPDWDLAARDVIESLQGEKKS